MNDELLLRRAVLENPFEDTVRLVYADWCDENDKPVKASYIRYGIKHPQNSAVCLCSTAVQPCILCQAFEKEMYYITALNVPHYVVHRGFVNEIRCSQGWFVNNALNVQQIFEVNPITKVLLLEKSAGNSRRGSRGERCSTWWSNSQSAESFSTIDYRIFKYLKPKPEGNQYVRRYKEPHQAAADLSLACVNLGRSYAGLEPLPRKEEL